MITNLLCLSNGHGEDAIAVRILQALQQQEHPPKLAALPLVGEGQAYTQLQIPIIGSVQSMPSGGFFFMKGRELIGDLRSGLVQLIWSQLKAIRNWVRFHAQSGNQVAILAVGDIVPLSFAWWSGINYAFVGTARSEYYLRDETGLLPRQSWFQQLEAYSGSVYQPWELWLMKHPRCLAVFPRDRLTAEILQTRSIRAFDLGNPMMDGFLEERGSILHSTLNAPHLLEHSTLHITLLPGSRVPEAYANWQQIMSAVDGVIAVLPSKSLVFLGAIAPTLNLDRLRPALVASGWKPITDLSFIKANATLVLSQNAYADYCLRGNLAIAMAGTATEQFVGLGKPAIAIPGKGPQFTPAFAEAQSRLLGPSLILVDNPTEVAGAMGQLLSQPERWPLIAQNGQRRLGEPGAARRIADCLMAKLS
ncbi:MAG: lipid-A-disaccharide synthase-related protein [Cyanosarcina radialis HA8281-LM2]|jgi:uncharacterized protein (TIGR03492 family)|nr:lipid-A-disaccharide synthase-related protein [Cyanosarcina radialis HA8281-LM2]